jgi:autotransporter-associated beta strand protein
MEINLGTLRAAAPDALSGSMIVNKEGTLDIALGQDPGVDSLSGSGHVVLEGDLLLENGGTSTFSGTISGAGSLVLEGDGVQVLSGNNTYTGQTIVSFGSTGTLRAWSANAFGNTSGVHLDSSGSTLDLNNFNIAVRSLGGSGNVLLGSGTLTEGAGNGNDTFAGVISGSGGLTKVGTGTLTLTGINTFTGTANVTSGTLEVDGGVSGTVNLGTGTTLAGTGAVGFYFGSGTVSPGTSSKTGVLDIGDLPDLSNSRVRIRLNGTTPGTGYDQLLGEGIVTLGGTATLDLSANFASPIGTTFTILSVDFDALFDGLVDRTFAGLPDGTVFTASGQLFRINYTFNSVVLTHIGASVQIDASALGSQQNPTPLFIDGVQQNSSVVTTDLLPGSHTFFTYGGSTQTFNIDNNGVLSLVNGKLGTVTGNKLTIKGFAVNIDASILGTPANPTPLYLDSQLQASPVLTTGLLPGSHTFFTYGGSTQYFNVDDNGVLSLVNGKLGKMLDNKLTITGILVNLDASALGTMANPTPLYLDGVLQATTKFTAHLLPGSHAFASLGGVAQYFDVADGGVVSLQNGLLGTVIGNNSLTITGFPVNIDTKALGVTTLYVDGVALDATNLIHMKLLPGLHAFATPASKAAHYFNVGDQGMISLLNALDGSVNGNLLTLTQAG